MKVYLFEVGIKPRIIEIDNTLEEMQKIVGGYIETLNFHDSMVVVFDEEYLLKRLKPLEGPTMNVAGTHLYGKVFICSIKGEEFVGLSKAEIKEIEKCL